MAKLPKKRQILIEGPDGAGKSTLVHRLNEHVCWDTRFLHHRNGDQFQRYLQEYSTHDQTIFERGHVSEWVYGNAWRGNAWDGTRKELKILDAIVGERMIVIACLPDERLLAKRYEERGYDFDLKKNLEEIPHLFGRYFDERLKPTFTYQSRDMDELEELVHNVEKRCKSR